MLPIASGLVASVHAQATQDMVLRCGPVFDQVLDHAVKPKALLDCTKESTETDRSGFAQVCFFTLGFYVSGWKDAADYLESECDRRLVVEGALGFREMLKEAKSYSPKPVVTSAMGAKKLSGGGRVTGRDWALISTPRNDQSKLANERAALERQQKLQVDRIAQPARQ
ncbi:MAG TPA: hypothetical protein VI299_28910 [Polyangiales bacterium]